MLNPCKKICYSFPVWQFIVFIALAHSQTPAQLNGEWISNKFGYMKIEDEKIIYEQGWYWTVPELDKYLEGTYDKTSPVFTDRLKDARYRTVYTDHIINKDTISGADGRLALIINMVSTDTIEIVDIGLKTGIPLIFTRLNTVTETSNTKSLRTSVHSIHCHGEQTMLNKPAFAYGYKVDLLLTDDELISVCERSGISDTTYIKGELRDRIATILSYIPDDMPSEFAGFVSDGTKYRITLSDNQTKREFSGYVIPYLMKEIIVKLRDHYTEKFNE